MGNFYYYFGMFSFWFIIGIFTIGFIIMFINYIIPKINFRNYIKTQIKNVVFVKHDKKLCKNGDIEWIDCGLGGYASFSNTEWDDFDKKNQFRKINWREYYDYVGINYIDKLFLIGIK